MLFGQAGVFACMGAGCFLIPSVLIVFMFSAPCDVLILFRRFCVLDFVYFVVPCMVENSYCCDSFCLESLTPADLFVELFFSFFFLLILCGKDEGKTGFIMLKAFFFRVMF